MTFSESRQVGCSSNNKVLPRRKTPFINTFVAQQYTLGSKSLWIRVSNETGQRDRSSFIVPGQRENRTSSKSYQGTRRDAGQDSTIF